VSEAFNIPPGSVTHLYDEGDEIGLGDRSLRVLHTPGHAAGCISLFDSSRRVLFSGDVVYPGNLFVCFPDSDFDEYCASIQRMAALSSQVRLLLPGHGPFPLPLDLVRRLNDWLHAVVAGQVSSSVSSSPWGTVRVYEGPDFNLLLHL
jgi:glyoxylase-like metal-dependent hydrolase (beta-lactamase superfamily II)